MPKVIVAYMPVVHQGYLRFFAEQAEATIYILDRELTQTYEPLQKDIRALEPSQIVASLQALLPGRSIEIATRQTLAELNQSDQDISLPDEDISHQIATEFLSQAKTSFSSIFLRWDKNRATFQTEPQPTATITQNEFMSQALTNSQKSADWWRQVGGVIVKDGKVILEAHNHHLPHQQQPYIVGDPRASFHKGENIELSTAIHAEANLIAQAAQQGLAVSGASLYVTTFPCPVCAKLVAESGIKELYYADGYAMLDGEEILKSRGVKLTKLDLSPA